MVNEGPQRSAGRSSRRGFLRTVSGGGLLATAALGSGVARGCVAGTDEDGQARRAQEPPLTERWRYTGTDQSVGPPTVVDGTVYAVAGASVWAIDGATGDRIWRFETGDADTYGDTPVTVVDGLVFAVFDGLYALDATDGLERWKFAPEERLDTGPTVGRTRDGPAVFVGGDDGTLYAVDAADGSIRWTRTADEDVIRSPLLEDGTVYVVRRNDTLLAVDATDGTEQWRHAEIPYPSSPTVADGTVFVGSTRERLYALDASDGTTQWRYRTEGGIETTPTVRDGTVYVCEANESVCWFYTEVYALDAEDGTEQWVVDTERPNNTPPTFVDDTLVCVGQDQVVAIDPGGGKVRWTFELAGTETAATVVDGTVYLGVEHGVVALESDFDGSSAGSRALFGTDGHHDAWQATGYELGDKGFVATDSPLAISLGDESTGGTETKATPTETAVSQTATGTGTDRSTATSAGETATGTTRSDTTTDGGAGPGFGVVGTLAGLGGAGYLLHRRLSADGDSDA